MKLENREITTIVSDFDGTLIRFGENKPTSKFYQVVDDLLEQGLRFVAASGRKYSDLNKIMGPYSDRIAFIAENGALVVWHDKVLHKSIIKRTLAIDLIEDLEKLENAEIMVSGESVSYITTDNPTFIEMLQTNFSLKLVSLKDFEDIQEDIIKVAANFKDGIPDKVKKHFHEKYDELFFVADSGKGWLDFMPKECSKGNALEELSNILNFNLNETVAFGDSENDIEMLKVAGIGYAMDFSEEKVKCVADFICDSVEETLKNGLGNKNRRIENEKMY